MNAHSEDLVAHEVEEDVTVGLVANLAFITQLVVDFHELPEAVGQGDQRGVSYGDIVRGCWERKSVEIFERYTRMPCQAADRKNPISISFF